MGYENGPPADHPVNDEVPPDDTGTSVANGKKPMPDWGPLLARTKKGEALNNLDNVVMIIERHPDLAGKIWFDIFLGAVRTNWEGPERNWDDTEDIRLQLFMQRGMGLTKINAQTCHDAAFMAAKHDVRDECAEYLKSRRWDRTKRLDFVMHEAFGAADNQYSASVGRCWFISMVARVLSPGCKVDTVPVLEGKQGKGKSSALAIIGGKWFIECHANVLDKDFYGILDGHMLVEIAEMHSFSRLDVEKIKGIISCPVDRYRRPYGRNTQDHPRRSVLAGTTNRDDWQKDETGARRFWPILCNEIDLEYLRANRDQLFAEAVEYFSQGMPWWDMPEEDQKREVESRRDVDSWEATIELWLIGRERPTTQEVLLDCLRIEIGKHDQMVQKRIGRIMRFIGWRPFVSKDSGKSKRCWVKDV